MSWSNRHECKFVVPEAVAARVRDQVMPFVVPDPHAEGRPGHTYPIASLYLDDATRSLYRETIEGQAHRFKLRIRAYDDRPDSRVFVEIKRRIDRVVQKVRCPIPRCSLPAVLAGDADAVPALTPLQRAAIEEFVRLTMLRRAAPQLIVRYRRQAYIGRDEPEVRVTFDRALAASTEHGPIVRHGGRFDPLPLQQVVLELKFTDLCPPWMQRVVRACELRRGSFSKYCRSAETLADVGRLIMR